MSTETNKHTPTPWSICEHRNGHKLEIIANDGIVCTVAGTSSSAVETQANARLIVEAVNQHPTLLTIADVARRLGEKVERANIVQHSGGNVCSEDWSELYHLQNELGSALAQLTKEKESK